MSFWFYRKKGNKSSIYSASIPFELILIFFGIFAAVVIPRYMFNSSQMGKDSLLLLIIGFILLFISKLSLFSKGIWNSWGTKQMNKIFKYLYRLGYGLIGIGCIGVLIYI